MKEFKKYLVERFIELEHEINVNQIELKKVKDFSKEFATEKRLIELIARQTEIALVMQKYKEVMIKEINEKIKKGD